MTEPTAGEIMVADKAQALSTRPGRPTLGNSRRGMILWTVVLGCAFCLPIRDLVRYAWQSDFYSYILLIPFVSFYLARLERNRANFSSESSGKLAVVTLGTGLLILAAYGIGARHGWQLGTEDYLALMMLSFLCLLLSGAFLFVGKKRLRQIAFPLAFLIFIVPLPTVLHLWVEAFLQHGSAYAAQAMLEIAGMPLLKQGTVFHMPGFSLEVAPECSGIHSTMVLFIISLVGGYLFLRKPWKRVFFTAVVLPLALLRNGLRVFTISELCVNINPDMIDSFIHRKGGPIFFALSLLPFFLILFLLRKSERKSELASKTPLA